MKLSIRISYVLSFLLISFLSCLPCYAQYGPLYRGDLNAGISIGLGSDRYYNNYPYLTNYEAHGTPYAEIAISERHMVGIQFNIGNRYYKSEEALRHFRNTQHPPSYAKQLTSGYHILHDFGFRHSTVYRVKIKRYRHGLFLRSTFSAGVHRTTQADYSFIEYPQNPNLPPVKFGTRPAKKPGSPFGWYVQGIGMIEYNIDDDASCFLTTNFSAGRSTNRVEYYEEIQQNLVKSETYTEEVHRLAFSIQLGICGWFN